MIESMLQELGLSEYEIKIYLTLINLGESVAGKVAEAAKVNRRNVYDALNRLIKRGFVSFSNKNSKNLYAAVHPNKVLFLYKAKVDLVKHLLPELINNYNGPRSEREVQIFEDNEGIKTVFQKLYEENKMVFVIGSTGLSLERIPFFMNQISKKKNIKLKQLWNYDAKNREEYQKILPSEDRILPKNFKTSTQIFISGDKAVILIWSKVPLAIWIKDLEITKGFKSYFNFLWGVSTSLK